MASAQHTNELQQAFQSFNQLSKQLIESYSTLERRFVHLGQALDNRASPEQRVTKRLRSVLDALPAGVIVLDGAGLVCECNPAAGEMLGEPLLGQHWRDIIARSFAPRADDGHDISLLNGRRVNLATTPLGDEPGQIVSLTDVTRTRELQDKLHHFERLSATGEMAAGLAHQLRTPLSAAVLYLGMLKRADLSADARHPLVEKTLARLRHVEALVRDMLLLARADHDGGEPVAIPDLISMLEQFARPLIPAERIQFTFDNPINGAVLRAQRDVLISALQNLINNAVQSIEGVGAVHVGAIQREIGWVEISVRDTGKGMTPEQLQRIGQPFYTTRDEGTGLGLAVVNAVVKAHHGTLNFESQVGTGSTVTVRLPTLSSHSVSTARSS